MSIQNIHIEISFDTTLQYNILGYLVHSAAELNFKLFSFSGSSTATATRESVMVNRNRTRLSSACLVFGVSSSYGCIIHNTDSGVCSYKYRPATSEPDAVARAESLWKADMPFCGKWIADYYAPCVPSTPTDAWTAADANFPFGRLSTSDSQQVDVHSIRSKDAWIEQTVTNSIQSRIELEKTQGSRYYRYFRNKDCQDAYARYTCWINFPRCSDDTLESLPLCQSGERTISTGSMLHMSWPTHL